MMSLERSKIGANIRNYIELNKALEIDGIGRLIKTSAEPSLSSNTHLFLPGNENYELVDSIGEESDQFINYLSEVNSFSLEYARQYYKKIVGELIFNLETKGKVNVGGLGNFYVLNGNYFLEQASISTNDHFYGLPTLQLKPLMLAKSEEVVKTSKISPAPAVSNNKERNFLYKVAAIAAIFIILITMYDIWGSPVDTNNQLSSIEIDKARLNQNPAKLLVSEELSAELIPGIIKKEEEKTTSCALIIGSFARKSNAIELQQKVIEAGYELYTEEFHEFYRVGVAYDCSDVRGASFKEIEQTLGIDPWLRIVN
jgi:hypothetical protein